GGGADGPGPAQGGPLVLAQVARGLLERAHVVRHRVGRGGGGVVGVGGIGRHGTSLRREWGMGNRDPASLAAAGNANGPVSGAAAGSVEGLDRERQSSFFDMSSSATTSAAAHSRASRSLRSRSAFSTASMYSASIWRAAISR